MNKRQFFQFLGLAAAFSAGAVEMPLTNPPVPFVKQTNAVEEQSKPVFDAKGKRIMFGSKVLQFFESGYVNVTYAGKPFGQLYFYGSTPFSGWMPNTNTQTKAPHPCTKGLGIESFSADEKTKSFILKGKIPCQKLGQPEILGDYEFKATLLPTNKVQFRLEYKCPAELKRGAINMMCKFPMAKKYKIAQQEYTFPKPKGQQQYLRPADIKVLTGTEKDDARLIFQSNVMVYARPRGLIAFSANKNPKTPGQNVIVYEFDPITWSGKASTGAVDLREVDALDPEVPASRNLMQNPYFAQGLNHVGVHHQVFHYWGTEMVKLSKENPKFGENCLMADSMGLCIQPPLISAEPGDYTFSWYARADHENEAVTSLYASNHAYNYFLKGSKKFKVGKEWKRYQVTVHVNSVSGLRFQLSVASKKKGPYKVFLDGLQLEKGNKATAFDCSPATSCLETSAKDDFIRHGDKINGKLRLTTLLDKVSGNLNVSVQDIFGTELYKTSSKFNFGKKEHPEIPLAMDGKIPDGIFKVKVDFDVNGKKYTEYFRFSVMPFFANKHKIKNLFSNNYNGGQCYVDVYPGLENYYRRSMYFGAGSDSHQPLTTKEREKLMAKYNFEYVDFNIAGRTWPKGVTQHFPGAKPLPGHTYYFFSWGDTRFILWRGKCGLLLDHRLSGGWTPEFRKKVVKTTEYVVRKSSPRKVYAIGSEWADEIKSDPHYIDLVLAVREGVKNVYPNSMFCEAGSYNMDVGGGVREIDSTLTRLKGKMPIEAIHSHTYTQDVLAIETNFKALVDTVENKHGHKNVKYYFGEGMHYSPHEVPAWGLVSASWNGVNNFCTASTISYDFGWTEKISSAYAMRNWLIYLKKINQVLAANSSMRIAMDVQLRPRIYQKIPNTLSLMLGNAKRFVKDVSFAQHTKCLIWEDEKGRPVVAVWYQEPAADRGLKQGPWATAKLPADVEIYDMMGVKRVTPKDGRFPVSVFPFFFRGKPGQVDSYVKIFANAEVIGDTSSPFRTSLDITSRTEATLTLENFKARPVSGTVKAGGKSVNVKLAPLAKTQVKAPLTPAIPYDRLTSVTTKYSVTTNGKTTEASDNFVGLSVKRFTGDWDKIPSFAITNFTRKNLKVPAANFSARAQLAWDKDNFYIRVTVKDNKFVHVEQPAIEGRWNNDSLQIFIDTRCSARKSGVRTFDADDYAYTFIFDKGKPKLFRWRTPDIQLTLGTTAPKDLTIAEDVPCKFTKTKDGYVYETAIPSRYMLPARLEKNYAMGFALYLNDRDEGKKVKQSLTMTPDGTSAFNCPYLYPVILLTE